MPSHWRWPQSVGHVGSCDKGPSRGHEGRPACGPHGIQAILSVTVLKTLGLSKIEQIRFAYGGPAMCNASLDGSMIARAPAFLVRGGAAVH